MNKQAGAVRWFAPMVSLILFLALTTSALAQQAAPTPAAPTPNAAAPAATPGVKGTINGTVTNGTKGGGSVAGLDIDLYIYQGQNQAGKLTTKSDKDGKYSFSGVATGPDYTYLVHTLYQGADYASDPVTFPTGSTDQTANLQLFDSTTSDSNITMSARHYLLDPEPSGLYVSEIAIISNSGDKTYIGSKDVHQGLKETVRFSLPQGAQNVEYGGGLLGSRVFQDNGDLVDTWPLYPGDSQRIFRYQIPVNNGTATFSSKLSTNIGKVNVLIPDIGVGVSVSNLPNKSTQSIQDENYLLFSGDNLKAGTQLDFKLDHLSVAQAAASAGQATPGQPAQGQQGLLPLIAGSGVVILVLIAALVVMLVRSRRAATGKPVSPTSGDEGDEPRQASDLTEAEREAEDEILEEEKRGLVAAIARLDDDFESKKLSAEEYGQLRAEKKRQLVEVVERQKNLASARGDQ